MKSCVAFFSSLFFFQYFFLQLLKVGNDCVSLPPLLDALDFLHLPAQPGISGCFVWCDLLPPAPLRLTEAASPMSAHSGKSWDQTFWNRSPAGETHQQRSAPSEHFLDSFLERVWLLLFIYNSGICDLGLGSRFAFSAAWLQLCHQEERGRLCLRTSGILLAVVADAWEKWCHNFNSRPSWIRRIITHACHLFVMILSALTYLHIKALITISEDRKASFKMNSEGDLCSTSKVVFVCSGFPFVCVLFTRLNLIFMKCLLCQDVPDSPRRSFKKMLFWMCLIIAGISPSLFPI